MRIAFLVGRFPVISETFILNQITGLIDRGHEVDVFALDEPKPDVSKVHPDVNQYCLLERTFNTLEKPTNRSLRVLKGIRLLLAKCYREPLALVRLLNVFRQSKQPISLGYLLHLTYLSMPFLDKKPYDIIHCQFGTIAIQGIHLRDIGAIQGKLVTSFRGYDISYFVQLCGEQVYDNLFKVGNFFLANCDFFRSKAIKLGCDEKKIVVLRSGIDCDRFFFTPRFPPADGKVWIATTGRLVEKKGIEYSIRAVAKLAKSYQNIEYNIIGDGYLKENLQNLIQELEVGHVVKLLGAKQQEEIIEILNKSHIFVATSVTAADGNQDAPVNTLKEAMAMGLPVVGTLHGGIPELIEDEISGFLVPERDVDALALKLGYLIEHPEVWQQMGKAGRAHVEQHYDINRLNDQLVQIYEQLLVDEYVSEAASVVLERGIA